MAGPRDADRRREVVRVAVEATRPGLVLHGHWHWRHGTDLRWTDRENQVHVTRVEGLREMSTGDVEGASGVLDLRDRVSFPPGPPIPDAEWLRDDRIGPMYFGPVVYVLHVQLDGVEPPIWRRVVVEEDTKLPELSRILETAMGWEGYHLHHFEIGDEVIFSNPDPDADHAIDERKVTVRQVLPRDGATLVWEYDFGDSWGHTVTVEARDEPDPDARYPQVLDGARACPPEDCGGTWGYADLLETLADPSHPEYEHMVRWAPDSFDPEAFIVEAHDAAVRKVR